MQLMLLRNISLNYPMWSRKKLSNSIKIAATLSLGIPVIFYFNKWLFSRKSWKYIKKRCSNFNSNSGETQELKPVIKYANGNKIILIGIVSKKFSTTKASDIKLVIPVKEAGLGIMQPVVQASNWLLVGGSCNSK